MSVGIDDINLYTTPVMLSTEEIKIKRRLSDKAVADIGFEARSIVPCYEDVVTQAVNAAFPIVNDHVQDYNLLILATETGLDFGKPISTYVHKYLKLPSSCSNFEIKHACYSGTAALKMACAWVNQQPGNPKALVIMSDLGRGHFNDVSELTPGSGAIALSVTKNPRILEINAISGCATNEIYDVARPEKNLEYGDPVLSLSSFLDLAEMSWEDFNKKNKIDNIQEHFAYMLFHVPLVSLVKKTHAAIMELATNLDEEAVTNDFISRVQPGLSINAQTGNLFSAALYVSLISILLNIKEAPKRPISLFSYGSGACAEFFEGKIMPGASDIVKSKNIELMLKKRFIIDIETYEMLVNEQEKIYSSSDYQPNFDQLNQVYADYYANKHLLVLDKIERYHRTYKYS